MPAPGTPADRLPLHVGLSTGTVDQLGILSVSRALSSETSIEKLHGRVVEVLGTMTGATKVQLVWRDEPQGWLLPGSERGPGRSHDEHALPMTVLRYMQRSGELVVVADVTSDERFACDPYFADLPLCRAVGRTGRHSWSGRSRARARRHLDQRRVQRGAHRRRQAGRRSAGSVARQRPALRRLSQGRRRAGGPAPSGDTCRTRRAARRALRRCGRGGRQDPSGGGRRLRGPLRRGPHGRVRRRLGTGTEVGAPRGTCGPRGRQRCLARLRQQHAGVGRPPC